MCDVKKTCQLEESSVNKGQITEETTNELEF